jgi:hypothetical protein
MTENKSPSHTKENGKIVSTKNEGTNDQKNAKSQKSTSARGMKVGYHSEAANIGPEKEDTRGMKVGYHSEAANIGPEKEDTRGMKVGYHSEAANPSGHSERLHRKRKNKK